MVIYLEWGSYHQRSPHEAWSRVDDNRMLWNRLQELGYRPSGGEVPEGPNWPSWQAHLDELLTALFPFRGQVSQSNISSTR